MFELAFLLPCVLNELILSPFCFFADTYFAARPAKDQYRHRRNIPYEAFFSCDPRLYPAAEDLAQRQPANRCQTVYSKFPIPVTLLVDRYSTPLTFAVVAAVVSLLLIGLVVTFYCKYCSGPLPGEELPGKKKDLELQQVNFEKAGKGVGKKKKKKRTPKTPRDNNKETLLAFRQQQQHRRSPNKKPKDGQVDVDEEEGQGEESGEGTSSGTPSTSEAFTEKKTDNNTDTTTTTTSSNKKPQPPVVTVPKRTMSEVL